VARRTAKMTKTLVPNPEPIVAGMAAQNLDFDDFPISEILKTLQKAYGIEIIFDETTLKDCPVTARLTDLSLYEKLDLVCDAVGAVYQVIDGRIIVTGKGCGAM
jgi:transmembrane sensor